MGWALSHLRVSSIYKLDPKVVMTMHREKLAPYSARPSAGTVSTIMLLGYQWFWTTIYDQMMSTPFNMVDSILKILDILQVLKGCYKEVSFLFTHKWSFTDTPSQRQTVQTNIPKPTRVAGTVVLLNPPNITWLKTIKHWEFMTRA